MATTPDLSEFHDLARPRTRRTCKVGIAIEQLTGDEAAKVAAACVLLDEIATGTIVKWFKVRGHIDVSVSAVNYHRRGQCSCAG